jgi:hypothetical protein
MTAAGGFSLHGDCATLRAFAGVSGQQEERDVMDFDLGLSRQVTGSHG